MKKFIGWVAIFVVAGFGIHSCVNSDWSQALERRIEKEQVARETPHVIRRADGCKVYAFAVNSTEHYFTRCENTTMTQRNYTVLCNKNQRCPKTEEITTENSK